MKLSDADYLRLRRAIALEQLIVWSVPFDRPLTAACTLASLVNNTTVNCGTATTDATRPTGVRHRWRRPRPAMAQSSGS
jgi:hypothetical protein